MKVVLLASPCEATNIVYHALSREFPIDAIVLEQPVARGELIKRRMKRLGVLRVAGQLLFQAGALPLLRRASRARAAEIKREFALDDSPLPEERIRRVTSVNAPETTEVLQQLKPDVIVVNGTRVIAERVLRAVSATFINMHAGVTLLYRGVHGAYWALAKGDRENAGVTVHLVDAGIDTGGIVGRARVEPSPRDTFATYPLLQLAAGIPLLIDAVRRAAAGTLAVIDAPVGESRLWSHPTIIEYVRNAARRGVW